MDIIDNVNKTLKDDLASVTDFAERLSGFKAVQDLGNKVIIKATNEIQKLVDEKKQERIMHIGQQLTQLLVQESVFLQTVLRHLWYILL